MSLKQLASGCAIFGLIMATAPAVFSQGSPSFEIKDIRQQPGHRHGVLEQVLHRLSPG